MEKYHLFTETAWLKIDIVWWITRYFTSGTIISIGNIIPKSEEYYSLYYRRWGDLTGNYQEREDFDNVLKGVNYLIYWFCGNF